MNTLLALSGAFGVGSAFAYFFDPERGRDGDRSPGGER